MSNFYEILGVNPTDEISIIKKKTKQNLVNVDKTSKKYKEMKKAYKVLTSYFERKKYDEMLQNRSNNILQNRNNNILQNRNFLLNQPLFNPFFSPTILSLPLMDFKSNDNVKFQSYSSQIKPTNDGNYEKIEHWKSNGKEKNKSTIYDKKGNIIK